MVARRGARHRALLHEGFEDLAGPPGLFEVLVAQRLQRNRTRHVDGDEFVDPKAQGEAFDIAVEPPRQHQRGLQCRANRLVGFDRNENRLHVAAFPALPAS